MKLHQKVVYSLIEQYGVLSNQLIHSDLLGNYVMSVNILNIQNNCQFENYLITNYCRYNIQDFWVLSSYIGLKP